MFDELYDITIRLGVESTVWPGDPEYSRELVSSIAEGSVSNVSLLRMTAHTGTHVDTPAHFLAGGRGLDDYDAGEFIRPACVIEVPDAAVIPSAAVEAADVRPGDAVLFKTRNSLDGRIAAGEFFEDGVSLSVEAARRCLDRRAGLVGIDYFTVDAYGDRGFGAHYLLLGAGVLILETINLRDVPPGRYTLLCLPLRLAAAEASPVRAVLLRGGLGQDG
ncbi:MAG TPA: cyclase family protein [Phycisphaerae bacterium]|nr:cyclase family protein [Phycisphaerae bacterium]